MAADVEIAALGVSVISADTNRYAWFIGNAGNQTHTSNGVIGIGQNSLSSLESGDLLVAVGHQAMQNATTPGNVVAVGAYALRDANTVIDTVAVGNEALKVATTGVGGVAVGHWAMRNVQTAGGNTAVGDSTLYKCETGIENVSMGYTTSHENVAGTGNTEIGFAAGRTKTSGNYNVNVGHKAGFSALAGDNNVNVGVRAGESYSGNGQVAVGAFALLGATGNENTGIGTLAGGSITDGARNTFLGFEAGQHGDQKDDPVNSMALGAGTYTTADNQVVIGDEDVETFVFGGVVVPKASLLRPAMTPYLTKTVRMADTALGISAPANVYIPFQSIVTSLDFDLFPATHFRLIVRGNSTESGQTCIFQIDRDETGAGSPISASGNDLTLPYNAGTYGFFDSGWREITASLTGLQNFFVRVKRSNSTCDALMRHMQIEWKIEI